MSIAADGAVMLSLIGVATVRLCCGLLIVKTLALFLGPEQFGIVSQVMGISVIFFMLAGGGATTGLIQVVSGETERSERDRWLAANLAIGIAAAALLTLVAGAMYLTMSQPLFGDPAMASLFLGIAIAQSVVGLGNIILAYCSAAGQIRAFALTNIVGTLLWAAITVIGTITLGFTGASWAVVLAPMCPAFIALIVMRKSLRPIWGRIAQFETEKSSYLLKFIAATLLAVCAVPVVHLVIRADLAHRSGWREVGQWQAIARLADAYMQVFGILAINLLLPRLSGAVSHAAWLSAMRHIGGAMLGLFFGGAVTLYFLGAHVIRYAYSQEFLPALQHLTPQLLADFCKVAAWILIYHFVATGRVWVQATTEVLQAVGLLAGYFVLWPVYGAGAPVVANLAVCVVLLIGLSIMVWNDKFRNRTPCES